MVEYEVSPEVLEQAKNSTIIISKQVREHRLKVFNSVLSLVRKTLEYDKQLLREEQRLRNYRKQEEELESNIEVANKFVNMELISSEELKRVKEKIKELEDTYKKTKECTAVFKSYICNLSQTILDNKKFWYYTLEGLVNDEPILNEKEIDIKYIKEYAYLIEVLQNWEYMSWFKAKSSSADNDLRPIKEKILNDEELTAEETAEIIRLLKLI